MKLRLLAVMTTAAIVAAVLADSWSFPPTMEKKVHEFGRSRIVLERDATQNQRYPAFSLTVYLDDEMVARYPNVGVEQIFASPDNRYFVGLSNHGLPGTAFVVFDRYGNLIREQKHQFNDFRIYTESSVTLTRKWYDDTNPEVDFGLTGEFLRGVRVNGSADRRYNLLDRDLGLRPDEWKAPFRPRQPRPTSQPG